MHPVFSWLYGSQEPQPQAQAQTIVESVPRSSGSVAFDLHVQEASAKNGDGGRAVSLTWDETEAMGISPDMRVNSLGMTEYERKETLLLAYLGNAWVSACIDVIVKRVTSGGYVLPETQPGQGNESELQTVTDFILRINDDWDFLQIVRSTLTSLLIFGEAYWEITWKGGVPYRVYLIDTLTMSFQCDAHGHITNYIQTLNHRSESISLPPQNIIRWWLPHPRSNVQALSPMERILDAINLDKKMVNWMTTFFQKGAKAPFWIKTGAEDVDGANRFFKWFKENFTGEKNAHMPLMTWGDGSIQEFKSGAIDVDFTVGRKSNRDEVLAAYSVPPAAVSLIESGNIGGGTGEDQDNSLQYNACDPLKDLFFEKFNFRLIQQGFKITSYKVSTRYADYRSSLTVAQIQDTHIKNGSLTVNEAREESGKRPYEQYGDTPVIVTTKEITPLDRLSQLSQEQSQQAQIGIQQAQAQLEQTQVQIQKAKEPQPQAVVVQPSHAAEPATPAPVTSKPKPQATTQESNAQAMGENHTGVMVAFMLDRFTAKQLALPNGIAPGDMHCTLCYLGDTYDVQRSGMLHPAKDVEKLKSVLANFASTAKPIVGRVGGLTRFINPNSDTTPVVANVNAPGLQAWQRALSDALTDAFFHVASDFDYTPHITLTYIHDDAPMPVESIPSQIYFHFDVMTLCVGDDRYTFPLGTALQEDAKQWQSPDAEIVIGMYQSQGYQFGTWLAHPDCCDACKLADGQTVKLGENFANGVQTIPLHPHCRCELIPSHDIPTKAQKDQFMSDWINQRGFN